MACSKEALECAVEEFQQGREKEASFRLIFDCFYPVVRRFFARKGVPSEDCYDLTQRTLINVYENLDAFRRESALRTWVSTIAFNAFKKWLRQKKRRDTEISLEPAESTESTTNAEIPDSRASQEEEAVKKERRERLKRCLDELSSRQRLSFILYTYHELSYREIAETMGVEVGTVGALLNQARNKLKEHFGAEFA